MAEVKGTMRVSVTIDKEEAFEALVRELGLTRPILGNSLDEYWQVEQSGDRKVVALYEDTSYHGSSSYRRNPCYSITDPKEVRMYELLEELKKLIQD